MRLEVSGDAPAASLAKLVNALKLDPERDVKIHTLIRPSSPDLVALFERQRRPGQGG